MKKLLLGACAALMLVGASCSKGNDANSEIPKKLSDSISMYSGASLGYYVLSDYINYMRQSDSSMSKEDMLKGIQMVFANADSEGTMVGIQIGSQILNQLKRYEDEGVKIDRNIVLKNFRQVFLSDTLIMDNLSDLNVQLNSLMGQVQEIKEAQSKAAQEEAAMEAKKQFEQYIASLQAEDPEVKTSESGLAYRIFEPGTEPYVTGDSQISVIYTGRLEDGTVFDHTIEGQPATFSPAGVIPGFAEGLELLGKGGKATLYIPGNLAYGANGVPQAGIGPFQTLIFDVEVVDVTHPAE